MITATRKRPEGRDEGLTLIELLVVVVIIGIRSAIAIPTFLDQRRRAWTTAVQSDLRSAALFQETAFTDTSSYAPADATLVTAGLRSTTGVTVTIVDGDADYFCMSAVHASLTGVTYYISSATRTPTTIAYVADTP